MPILGKVGVQRVINGPIPYSPDGNPYIGPAHGLPNFYHCCCFSFGIAQAGGAGKTLAEWIVDGEPEWDFWTFDPRRYTDYATKTYVVAKAHRALPERIRRRLSRRGVARRPPGQDDAALRPAEGQGRDVRRPRRLGARGLVSRAPRTSRSRSPSFRRAETGS